jgi:hypothetical protein
MLDGIKIHGDISTQPWRNPYLIQRLERPYKSEGPLGDISRAFAFGGGLKDGGLSKEAYALVNKLWRFDYMGASEFEWGAVPAALGAIFEYRKAEVLDGFALRLTGPAPEARHKDRLAYPECSKTKTKTADLVVLCHKAHRTNVIDTLERLTAEDYVREPRLKESSNAWHATFGQPHVDVIGGLELDNGWIYLSAEATDSVRGLCQLFGVELEPTDVVFGSKPIPKAKKGKN